MLYCILSETLLPALTPILTKMIPHECYMPLEFIARTDSNDHQIKWVLPNKSIITIPFDELPTLPEDPDDCMYLTNDFDAYCIYVTVTTESVIVTCSVGMIGSLTVTYTGEDMVTIMTDYEQLRSYQTNQRSVM